MIPNIYKDAPNARRADGRCFLQPSRVRVIKRSLRPELVLVIELDENIKYNIENYPVDENLLLQHNVLLPNN